MKAPLFHLKKIIAEYILSYNMRFIPQALGNG